MLSRWPEGRPERLCSPQRELRVILFFMELEYSLFRLAPGGEFGDVLCTSASAVTREL
jgi:hypothetical protein